MSQSQIENLDVLPDNWVWTTIGDIADTTRQRTNPQNYPNLKFIGMENVEAHTMRLLGTVPASEMVSNAEHFYSGDVLYGRMRPYLNKVYQPDFEGLCSGEFIIFRRTPEIDNSYLQYFLNSWAFVSFTSHLTEGDRPRISFEQMAGYPFPLAPLAEQRRIVAAIETHFTRLDTAVATLHRLQANLKRYRAAVLKAACAGRLVPQDPTDEPATQLLARILTERRSRWQAANPGKKYQEPIPPDTSSLPDLPEGWVWTNIGYIFDVKLGSTPSRNKEEYWNGDIPWVSSGEVAFGRIKNTNEYISQAGFANSSVKLNPPGTVLLAMIGEGKTRGQAAILDIEATNNQNVAAILCSQTAIPSEWVFWWLMSRYEQTRRGGMGGMQPALNSERVKALFIPLAPLAEMQQILIQVEKLTSNLDQLEKAIRANLARSARLRQSILKRAFSGRLVPQEPNDEPASVLLERIKATRTGKAKSQQMKLEGV